MNKSLRALALSPLAKKLCYVHSTAKKPNGICSGEQLFENYTI
jgi:hypothetical protein